MLIHQYDSATDAYTSSRLADPDPLNADRWLVPAFSTDTALPDRPRATWPFFLAGTWVLKPDFRGLLLYRQDTGEPAEIMQPGSTPESSGLTDTPRPSGQHKWGGSGWVLDAEAVALKTRADAMAEFDARMETARKKNAGKSDAIAAGLLTPGEIGVFKAWAAYQLALVRVMESAGFPSERGWPDEPDEAAAAAQGEAEAAAEQAARDAHAATLVGVTE